MARLTFQERIVVRILAPIFLLLLWATARAADLVTLMRVPDAGIQPQVAVDGDGAVHLIYFKGDPKAGDLFYVRSTDDGANWSKAVRVNSEANAAIAMGNIRGAHLALGKGNRPHVAWMGSSKVTPEGNNKKTPMLYTRLSDKGDAFEAQRNVIQFAYGLDGGGSLAADAKGNVYVVWHAGADKTGEENRRVWLASSNDDGKTFAREKSIDDGKSGACGCCGMKIMAADAGVFVLYRAAIEKVNRDMILLGSYDGGKVFRPQAVDAWESQTCPMSTAALVPGARAPLLAWQRQGHVALALIDPKSFRVMSVTKAPQVQGAQPDQQKHPALAVDAKGSRLLAWTEGMGWDRGGAVAWQVYDEAGKPVAKETGLKFGVPKWSLVAAFATKDGGFVVMY
jgi:hypothetical protein